MLSFCAVCGPNYVPEQHRRWTLDGPFAVPVGNIWLTCGHAVVCLWLKSGKQESYHPVCGPHESADFRPHMDQNIFVIHIYTDTHDNDAIIIILTHKLHTIYDTLNP